MQAHIFRVCLALSLYYEAGERILVQKTELTIIGDAEPEVLSKDIVAEEEPLRNMPITVTNEVLARLNGKKLSGVANPEVLFQRFFD